MLWSRALESLLSWIHVDRQETTFGLVSNTEMVIQAFHAFEPVTFTKFDF
jgi:hypothetical protein